MASTGPNNGTDIGLYIDGLLIGLLTSNDVSFEMAVRDATTKDSAGWKTGLTGLRSGSFNCDGFFAEDETTNFEDMFDLLNTRATATIRYGSTTIGDKVYEGTCNVTNVQRTAPVEETETFSCALELTGAPTKVTVT